MGCDNLDGGNALQGVEGITPIMEKGTLSDLAKTRRDREGERCCATLLELFGCDLNDPNFVGTPARWWRALNELIVSKTDYAGQLTELTSHIITFPSGHSELVTVTGIDASGVCPHHILPVHYDIDFAYVPKSRAIGLSKIPRIVRLFARKPMLQEDLTKLIADTFMQLLQCNGVMVVLRGRHDCMRVRGAKAVNTVTTTSAIRGIFSTESDLRAETLALFREAH